VRLVAAYATEQLRPRRVVLCIDAENAASAAVARSCGFELADDAPVRRRSRGRETTLRTRVQIGLAALGVAPLDRSRARR
jgi:RimJ/RimL family protein N-acetyltransferase